MFPEKKCFITLVLNWFINSPTQTVCIRFLLWARWCLKCSGQSNEQRKQSPSPSAWTLSREGDRGWGVIAGGCTLVRVVGAFWYTMVREGLSKSWTLRGDMKEVREPPWEYLEEQGPGKRGQRVQWWMMGSRENREFSVAGAEWAGEKATAGGEKGNRKPWGLGGHLKNFKFYSKVRTTEQCPHKRSCLNSWLKKNYPSPP